MCVHSARVEGGELFDKVVEVGKFSEPVAKLLFYQLLIAVKVRQELMTSAVHSVHGSCHFVSLVSSRQGHHTQGPEGMLHVRAYVSTA